MNSMLYLVSLALIISAMTDIECQNSDKHLEDARTPRESFYLGPLKIEATYNQTNLKEKLRLGKSYYKVKFFDKNSPDTCYGSIKMSRLEELVRCDNLTLESSEVPQILDCLPIEAFLSDIKTSTSSSSNYVQRSSIRLRPNLLKLLPLVHSEHRVYPMDKNLVQKNINNLVEFHNLTNLDFTDSKVDLGYYFESYLKQHRDEANPIVCTGKLFLSINQTDALARVPNDPYPEFLDESYHTIEQSWKNGYLLSLQDVSCTKSGLAWIFSLTGSFTIIQRLKFPYLIVRHTIAASPMEAILDYVAEVDQTLVQEAGPSAYNTTVRIKSRSVVVDFMNFDLDQVFANEDLENGIEKMKLIHATHGVALVDAIWNGEGLVKAISLMSMVESSGSQDGDTAPFYGLEEAVKLQYSKKKDDDFHRMSLSVKKNLIDPWMRNPFDQLMDLTEAAETTDKQPTKEEPHIKDEL